MIVRRGKADSPPDFAPPLTCAPDHRKAPRHESFGEFCRRGAAPAHSAFEDLSPRSLAVGECDQIERGNGQGNAVSHSSGRSIGLATRMLRYESAATRLRTALRALELRYSQDQPRVPAGNPDGGQWTEQIGVSGTGRRRQIAQGRQTFSGYYVGTHQDAATGVTYCVYYDSRNGYRFSVPKVSDKCPEIRLRY